MAPASCQVCRAGAGLVDLMPVSGDDGDDDAGGGLVRVIVAGPVAFYVRRACPVFAFYVRHFWFTRVLRVRPGWSGSGGHGLVTGGAGLPGGSCCAWGLPGDGSG